MYFSYQHAIESSIEEGRRHQGNQHNYHTRLAVEETSRQSEPNEEEHSASEVLSKDVPLGKSKVNVTTHLMNLHYHSKVLGWKDYYNLK